jgi:NhaA family Na+:H+ antiporter
MTRMNSEESLVKKITQPIRRFLDWDAAGGILLIGATILALVLANSPLEAAYTRFWQTPVSFTIDGEGFSKPLLLWVNDGLMAVFFFLVGLEIKREVIAGELSSFRKASLPFFAAIGGMLIPIGLFVLFQGDAPGKDAWGVPMATDIAFALGILSLLGDRTSLGLIVFLTAFAIIDDIGAILVIAVFFAHQVHWTALIIAAGLLVFLLICNLVFQVKRNWIYIVTGLFIWYFIFRSGLHPTIAGVLVALTIPARNKVKGNRLLESLRSFVRRFRSKENDLRLSRRFIREKEWHEIHQLEQKIKGVMPPLQRLEFRLEEFVSYFVIPVFALANAGISLSGGLSSVVEPFTLTIAGSLLFGKLIGVMGFSWFSIRLGLADLPSGTRWVHILGVGLLGGIGFTMAIFISNLALDTGDLLNQSKLGILLASLLAGASGYLLLKATLPKESDA